MSGSLWQSTGEFRWKCAILKPAEDSTRQQVRPNLLTSLILFSSSLKDLSVQRWPFHYLITPSGVYSVKWTWQSRVSAAKRSRSVWSCFTSRALKRITLDHVSPSGPNPVALRQKAVFSQPSEKQCRGLRNLYSVHSPVHIHWTRTCHAHIHTSLSAATRPAEQECKKKNMVKPPCFAATNSVHPDCKLS